MGHGVGPRGAGIHALRREDQPRVRAQGEGDTDAGVTVLGYLAGAAVAHNFLLASSPTGVGTWGPVAVVLGWVFCIAVGFLMREKA